MDGEQAPSERLQINDADATMYMYKYNCLAIDDGVFLVDPTETLTCRAKFVSKKPCIYPARASAAATQIPSNAWIAWLHNQRCLRRLHDRLGQSLLILIRTWKSMIVHRSRSRSVAWPWLRLLKLGRVWMTIPRSRVWLVS